MIANRSTFDHQLMLLRGNLLRLSEMVIQAITTAMDALEKNDLELAKQVDQNDSHINSLRFHIEEQCYDLVALQQPNAGDMRNLMATANIATNLERMGDHAAGIVRLQIRMGDHTNIAVPAEFRQMSELGIKMLQDAMTALEDRNQQLAKMTAIEDGKVDTLHKQLYDRLIQEMIHDPKSVEVNTYLLWISHNLERYADHVTNICERVVYVLSGILTEHLDAMP